MNVQLTRIADCAKVLPGYALKARTEHDPEGTHQAILGRHLARNMELGMAYRYLPEHELRITPRGSVEKYLVRKGDVLFVSRGSRNCATVVESVPGQTVATATFYVLRPCRNIEPGYLAWCLNLPSMQARIAQARTGAGTPIVQRRMFAELTLPVPALDKQCRIVELDRLMTKERVLRRQLLEQTNNLHRALGEKLLKHMAHCETDKSNSGEYFDVN